MNLFAHSITSKGGLAFARRIGTILNRFDLGGTRAEGYFLDYLATLGQFGANATFPITAVILRRHASFVHQLLDAGVEFAVHGYVHTDHGLLAEDEQFRQIQRALDVFRAEMVPAVGFRGPYLRYNDATVRVVDQLGFDYISNETFVYDVLDFGRYPKRAVEEYARAMRLYAAKPAGSSIVRPRLRGRLVQIPVALPDDEILVDRLGITSGEQMGATWTRVLDLAYDRGDILTLQLHPERGVICGKALSILVRAARQKAPTVWIAQLRDVAAWWKRRQRFQVRVDPAEPGRWQVSIAADPDATIWARNVASESTVPWFDQYATFGDSQAYVHASVRPIVGLSPRSEDVYAFLAEEGYVVDVAPDPAGYALYFDRPGPLSPTDQASLLDEIQKSDAPLIGISRWPQRARAAMSITGDIDALTLLDFVYRVWEVR